MKLIRYLLLVAAFLILSHADVLAQFNPTNPAEPTTPQQSYLLKTRVVPTNGGSVTSSTRLAAGASIALSANPYTNFQFVKWEDEEGETVSTSRSFTYYMPAKSVTLTAVFKYNPSAPAEPTTPAESATVSISVKPSGAGTSSGAGKYTVGSNVNVYTNAYSNYTFENWTCNGEVISNSPSFSYAVVSGENNLVANYRYTPGSPAEPEASARKYKLYLNVDPSNSGYLNVSSGNSYAAGNTVYLTANNYSNYEFIAWEDQNGNTVSTSPNLNYNMPEKSSTLTAQFRFNPGSPSEPSTPEPRRNIIYGARQTVTPGSSILYAINLENTDQLNGMAIDVSISDGLTADFTQARLGTRAENSQFSVQDLGSGSWRILVSGSSEIKGGNGAVILVPITVHSTAEPGTSIIIPMAKGVVYKTDGTQSPIDVTDGTLKIAETEITLPDSPDFVISDADVAAATLKIGDTVTVNWTVSNRGNIAAGSGWSETVSLVDSEGTRSTLGTVYFDTTGLGVGESVSRTAVFTVPEIPGIDGACNIQIALNPYTSSGEIEEYQINNIFNGSDEPINLEKELTLLAPKSLTEGTDTQARLRIVRSGNRSTSETYTLLKTAGDTRLRIPESVTIPRGQSGAYFLVYVDNNEDLDDNTAFSIQASGNGYRPTETNLEIIDDEFPEIELQIDAETLLEGENAILTVTLPKPAPEQLTISLSCDQVQRLTLPEIVTIAEGESTIKVEVIATENEKIENRADVTITATAPHYATGETFVFVEDNDMPMLHLELTPTAVSEGAGQRAIRAVVSRSTNLNSRVTILFTDDGVNALSYPSKVVLEPNVESYDFNIGVVDNQRVDGDRNIELTAAVFLSSCSCSAVRESGGSVSKTITVIDNDGPALALNASTSTLRRDMRKTTLTIGRNTTTELALTVALAADKEDALTLPGLVQIPAGQATTTVSIEAPESAFTGNENTVTLTASAQGMAMGTTLILISDRTLPDATVTVAADTKENFAPGAKFTATATVTNEGNAELPDAAPVDFYLSDSDVCVATVYTGKVIAPGEEATVSAEIKTPTIPGEYYLSAVVNSNGGIQELTRTNNESIPLPLTVKSPFNATVNVNKSAILPGEPVTVSGQTPGFGNKLEVYYITDNFRLTSSVIPDEAGRFSADIVPEIAGDYIVGVCVPGENKKEEMSSFTVRDIQIDNSSFLTYDLALGESKTLPLKITNSSSLPITGLTVKGVETPDNCTLEITAPDQIPAKGTVEVSVTITGNDLSKGDEWQKFSLLVSANDGIESSKRLFFYCRPNTPKLIASVNKISTTMAMGQQNVYRFKIANNGKGATGDITLALPSFMQQGTTTTLPSLNQGETVEVTLILTPNSEMQLNLPVTGCIGINCARGAGVALPFEVEPVSEITGRLIVDARDEYTFYTEDKPHLEGATVIISHPVSGAMIASGTTDADGLWSVELPTGFYNFEVSASKHTSASGTLQIAPGMDNDWPVFLPFNAITYDWTVVETTVDDEYEILTTVDFETRVPKPVVLVEFPDLKYANQIAYISITNKGLIEATNVQVLTPQPTEEVQMEIIGENLIPVLAAGETRRIPMRVSVDEEGKYEDFKKYVSDGMTYGSTETESEESQMLRTKGRSSGCVSVDCDVTVDNYKCDEITGEAKADGTKTIKGSYRTGDCGGTGSGLRGASVKTPPSFPGGFSNPHGLAGGSGSGQGVSAWDSYVAHRPYQWAMYGCTSDCERKIGDAAKACWDAFWACKKFNKPKKGHLKEYLKGCANDVKEKCTPTLSDILDRFEDRLDKCKGSGGDCADGKGCLEQLWKCLRSIKDAFDSCKALRKHIDNRNAPTRRAVLDNLDDPQVKRMESVMAYLDYMHLTIAYQNNILGPGDWSQVSAIQIDAMVTAALDHRNTDGYIILDETLLSQKPEQISRESFISFVERTNNTFRYEKTGEKSENMYDFDIEKELRETMVDIKDRIGQLGYQDFNELTDAASDAMEGYLDMSETPTDGVCTTITMEFRQTMVLTRQAFRGTLTITNGNEETSMTDVKLLMKVRDASGNLVGEREFAISPESIEGFKGGLDLTSGWELESKGSGKVTILFVPSKYAAPVEPLVYYFGGTLSYVDPFSGEEVSIELTPIEMTVSPSPILDLDYFMQRDVIGDDPLTERVERCEEAEFALLISNKGFGDASNLRMTTQQPQIVDNQKGLAIDFRITSSSINGTESNVAIGELIPTEFGTLNANSSVYAQWMMKSSLMGHFTKYDTKATQVSVYGSEDMSLLDRVEIHELIHGFTPEGATGGARGFLVNDINDVKGLPDNIYFSEQSTVSEVAEATEVTITEESQTSATVKITAAGPGWVYAGEKTPWADSRIVSSVVRESDGAELPSDNFWCTYVTLPTGGSPLYEERLHGIVNLTGTSETYRLTLQQRPHIDLMVDSFEGVPAEGEMQLTPVKEIGISFSKPIDEKTFKPECVNITCDGEPIDTTEITIESRVHAQLRQTKSITTTRSFNSDYVISLGDRANRSGFYVLSIDTHNILDNEGYRGVEMKSVSWSQLQDGKVLVTTFATPAEGGYTTPASERVGYKTIVNLCATPAEGYEFKGWSKDGASVSPDNKYLFTATEDAAYEATFELSRINVEVEYNAEEGNVSGNGTGLYPYGTRINITAIPNNGYTFSHWTNDAGDQICNDATLSIIATEDIILRPIFSAISVGADTLNEKDIVRIYPNPVHAHLNIAGEFDEIQKLTFITIDGKTVKIKSGYRPGDKIDVTQLPNGLYLLQIETDRGTTTHELLKD